MFDNAIQFFIGHAVFLDGASVDGNPRERQFGIDLECAKCVAQQPQFTNADLRVDASVRLFGVNTGGQQRRSNRVAARRRVAEAKTACVGENRTVQRLRNRRRDVQMQDGRKVVHKFGRRTRGGVGKTHAANRFVAGCVMVDNRNGNLEGTHRIGKCAKTAHIVDIEHEQQVDIREGFNTLRRAIVHTGQQEFVHHGPRCWIHDTHVYSQLREQMRHTDFRPATIAVGVDVRGQGDLHARTQ